jgi:hypothetical protein
MTINFHPNLIFSGKARSPPLDLSPVVGSSLAWKYYTGVEVNVSGKHSNLLQNRKNYKRNKLGANPWPMNSLSFVSYKYKTRL